MVVGWSLVWGCCCVSEHGVAVARQPRLVSVALLLTDNICEFVTLLCSPFWKFALKSPTKSIFNFLNVLFWMSSFPDCPVEVLLAALGPHQHFRLQGPLLKSCWVE